MESLSQFTQTAPQTQVFGTPAGHDPKPRESGLALLGFTVGCAYRNAAVGVLQVESPPVTAFQDVSGMR